MNVGNQRRGGKLEQEREGGSCGKMGQRCEEGTKNQAQEHAHKAKEREERERERRGREGGGKGQRKSQGEVGSPHHEKGGRTRC